MGRCGATCGPSARDVEIKGPLRHSLLVSLWALTAKTIRKYRYLQFMAVAELQLSSNNESNFMVVVHHDMRNCMDLRIQCQEG